VREWQRVDGSSAPLAVCVNLSPRTFQHPSLVTEVERALVESGLPSHCLRLEITEGVMMQDGESALRTLRTLRGLGLRLAIDDFGTGYSSLAYLQSLPVDILKIDRSFVGRMGQDFESLEIVRLIISLAKTLGMAVVGEGVETEEQLAALRALGGDQAQGFLFSRPLPPDEAGEFLRRASYAVVPAERR
jgi:EAL domain-containing protein (putative c-di-GMP-specific phosphodiesterase class I)